MPKLLFGKLYFSFFIHILSTNNEITNSFEIGGSLVNIQKLMRIHKSVVYLNSKCSGLAISTRHILTARHCINEHIYKIKQKHEYKTNNRFKPKLHGEELFIRNNLSVYIYEGSIIKRWIPVQSVYLINDIKGPNGNNITTNFTLFESDIAILKLFSRHHGTYENVCVNTNLMIGSRIYFSNFKPVNNQHEYPLTLLNRFCRIEEIRKNKIFHNCDSIEGSSGSIIYSIELDEKCGPFAYRPLLVGIISGAGWFNVTGSNQYIKKFKVATKISSKLAQFLHNITYDSLL